MARPKDFWDAPPTPPPEPRAATLCPYDRSPIRADGTCEATGGYPYGTKCPFACPVCRAPLQWTGLCDVCHGQQHASDPRCVPGDQYELYNDDGKPLGDGMHWMLWARGPQGFPSREEVQAIVANINRILAGPSVARGQSGPQRLGDVLRGLTIDPAVRAEVKRRETGAKET